MGMETLGSLKGKMPEAPRNPVKAFILFVCFNCV